MLNFTFFNAISARPFLLYLISAIGSTSIDIFLSIDIEIDWRSIAIYRKQKEKKYREKTEIEQTEINDNLESIREIAINSSIGKSLVCIKSGGANNYFASCKLNITRLNISVSMLTTNIFTFTFFFSPRFILS